jgi:hypothetical protein
MCEWDSGCYCQTDIERELDNRRYLAAKCTEPHANGSPCLPEWDGYVYICFDRICKERNEMRNGATLTERVEDDGTEG